MLGRPWQWLVAVAVATPLLLLGVAYLGYVWWPAAAMGDCPPRAHAMCFAFATAMAVGPLAAFAFVRRHTDPVHPRLTGAAIGAAAGSWGALAIGAHCGGTMPLHILAGHVLPLLLLMLLGAWIGGRGLSPSSSGAA